MLLLLITSIWAASTSLSVVTIMGLKLWEGR